MKQSLLVLCSVVFVVQVCVAQLPDCVTAVVRGPNHVELRWPTGLSTTNGYGSNIQRSFQNELQYTDLPNSLCPHNPPPLVGCVFQDMSVTPGEWFYRVKAIDLDGTVTFPCASIRVVVGTTNVEEEAPKSFGLFQNYPNPFNPATRIEYAIPKTSHVSLKVYDVLGREVATLVDEVQGSGFKSVEFDAGALTSGVYFYRLKTASVVSTKRMLFMK